MTPFDLLLILGFLASAATLGTALAQLARRRYGVAARLAFFGAAGAALYLTILVVVSLLSPGRTIRQGERRCHDDWRLAVEHAERSAATLGERHQVTLRLSSRARGRIQRAIRSRP